MFPKSADSDSTTLANQQNTSYLTKSYLIFKKHFHYGIFVKLVDQENATRGISSLHAAQYSAVTDCSEHQCFW